MKWRKTAVVGRYNHNMMLILLKFFSKFGIEELAARALVPLEVI